MRGKWYPSGLVFTRFTGEVFGQLCSRNKWVRTSRPDRHRYGTFTLSPSNGDCRISNTDLDASFLMALADLSWAVGQLAELSTRDFDVDELLRRLCEVAVQSLPVDGVGVMKTDRTAATRFVHASDPPLAGLEQLQETLQEGPCRDAIDTGKVVVAGSVAEMRWPNFEKVAAAIGIHAVLAVPMVSRGDGFGTLDLYWRAEHHADDDDRAAAQLCRSSR